QLVLSEHLVIRIRAELSRVGQEQSLPNLAACRQSEGPRSPRARRLDLKEVQAKLFSHRGYRRADHKPAGECRSLKRQLVALPDAELVRRLIEQGQREDSALPQRWPARQLELRGGGRSAQPRLDEDARNAAFCGDRNQRIERRASDEPQCAVAFDRESSSLVG